MLYALKLKQYKEKINKRIFLNKLNNIITLIYCTFLFYTSILMKLLRNDRILARKLFQDK